MRPSSCPSSPQASFRNHHRCRRQASSSSGACFLGARRLTSVVAVVTALAVLLVLVDPTDAQVCDNGMKPGDLVVTAWNADASWTAKPVVVITTTTDLDAGTEFYMTDRPIQCDASNSQCDFAPLTETYDDGTVKFTAPDAIDAGKTIAYTKHGVYFSSGNKFYQQNWQNVDWSGSSQFHLYTKNMKLDETAQEVQTGDNIVLYCMSGTQPIFLFTVLYSDDPTKTWTPPGGDLQEGLGIPVEGKIRVVDNDSCLDRWMSDDSENVVAWPYCHGADNQLFYYAPSLKHIRCKLNNKCMTAAGGNVHLAGCDGTQAEQRWYLDGEQLKNEAYGNDYCLDRNLGDGNIYMYRCHGGDNQKFIFAHDFWKGGSGHGERASVNSCAPPYGPKLLLTPATRVDSDIVLPDDGWSCSCDSFVESAEYTCSSDGSLEVYGGNVQEKGSVYCWDRWMPDDSENMIGYPCHGGDNQQFYYVRATKQIKCKLNDKCLTWNDDGGNNVYLSPCSASADPKQSWQQDDKERLLVEAASGYCLDRNLGNNNLYMYPCHDGNNQKFIFPARFFGEYSDTCASWNMETCNSPNPFWDPTDSCGKNGVTDSWEKRNHWRLIRPEECGKNEVEYVNYATNPDNWKYVGGHSKDPISKVDVTDPYSFFCEPPPERLETMVYEMKQQEAIADAELQWEFEQYQKKSSRSIAGLKFEEYKAAVKNFRNRRSKFFPDGVTPIPGNESPGTQIIDPRVPKCFGNPMCSNLDKEMDLREKLLGNDKSEAEQETGEGENQKLKKEHPLGKDVGNGNGLGTF